MQRSEKENSRVKVRAEMIKVLQEDKISEYSIKEAEKRSLDYEIERLNAQIARAEIKSDVHGTVVSEKLRDLIGQPVQFGQEIIKIARADRFFVEFQVPEDEVIFVRPGLGFKFKVFGHPDVSFKEGLKLLSVAGEGRPLTETETDKYFIARAEVLNSAEAILKPGMTGRAKIEADWRPLGYVLFYKPYRYLMTKILF
jgi:hypothetical protein